MRAQSAKRLARIENQSAKKSRGGYGLGGLFGDITNDDFEEVGKKKRKQRKKKGNLTEDFGDIGAYWKNPREKEEVKGYKAKKEVKKKKVKKGKRAPKVNAVVDMTPGERAQYEAQQLAHRLYGAKAKAPKFA